ncbi:hypothetical protein D9M68_685690 [compost metagenome]
MLLVLGGSRIGAEGHARCFAGPCHLLQGGPDLRVQRVWPQLQVECEVEGAFQDQANAGKPEDVGQCLEPGGALDHRHDGAGLVGQVDVLRQRQTAEAGDAAASDAAPSQRREQSRFRGPGNLFGAFHPRQDDGFGAGVQRSPDQLGVDFRNPQPGRDAGRLASAQAMHQLVAGAQQVFHVEDDEVIAGRGDHLAEKRGGNRVEQAVCALAVPNPGDDR